MTLRSMLTQTATVVHLTFDTTDPYGNPAPGTVTTVDYPARLEQTGGNEDVRDRDTTVSEWRLFLPPEAVIDRLDRVEVAGETFEVVGRPLRQRAPRGVHHIEAQLRTVEGG